MEQMCVMFFSLLKSLFFVCYLFFFIIKHTIQSEQRIQLLTKYKQIQREGMLGGIGANIYNRNKNDIFQCRKIMSKGSGMSALQLQRVSNGRKTQAHVEPRGASRFVLRR